MENPKPDLFAEWVCHCFEGDWRERDYINIILPDCNAMIILNRDDLYMTVYNPNRQLEELITQLAGVEGLFFYKRLGGKSKLEW